MYFPTVTSISNDGEYDTRPIVVKLYDIIVITSTWLGIPTKKLTAGEQNLYFFRIGALVIVIWKSRVKELKIHSNK